MDLLELVAKVLGPTVPAAVFLTEYSFARRARRQEEQHRQAVYSTLEHLGEGATSYETELAYLLNVASHDTQPTKVVEKEEPPQPPRFARLAAHFLIRFKDQEPMLGDLTEKYYEMLETRSPWVARLFFRWQIFLTFLAQFRLSTLIAAIGEVIRRIMS